MTLAIRARLTRGEFCLDVDVDLPAEGVTALFGRSGCGKTTLLRIVAGLENVKGARVHFNQQCWQQGREFLPLHKRRLGLVFQESSLLPHLSVQGNLLYGYKRTQPQLRRLQPGDVTEMLGIGELLTRSVDKLSGGQRQRVALGRALLTSPQLLLLDEPLAMLDSQTKAEIMPFLTRLASDAGVPMVFVSHSALEVEKLADRVAFMAEGSILSVESLQQATARVTSPLFQDAGPAAILHGDVGAPDGFKRLPFGPQHARFWLPQSVSQGRPGRQRLRVAARDVSLALGPVGQLSIQNQLPVTIEDIAPYQHQLLVSLKLADGQRVLAEITHHAAESLGLRPGMAVTALVKSVALIE